LAEIVPVVSEALEAQVRNLLPSQRGFGQDLQASNVITPIIDLTPTAEGTTTPEILQTALAFGSQTAFDVTNSSSTIITTTGFYRIIGTGSVNMQTTERSVDINMTDGLSTKKIWGLGDTGGGSNDRQSQGFDIVVFVASGISVTVTADEACNIVGSSRQIADVNGNLVNPTGFTPQ